MNTSYFKARAKSSVILLLIISLTLLLPISCKSEDNPGPPEKISIGFTVADTAALLLVADNQQLFAANGLEATLKTYPTALAALEGMKNGEVDIAENAEFPIISEAFRSTDISIIASVDRFDIVNLASRKDRGIQTVADLRGKTIGVPKGAVAEFYLGRFLELNGIGLNEVTIVNLPFQQAVDSLPAGTADAFAIRARDIDIVKEKLGDNVNIWPCQNGQGGFDVLSGHNGWISSHESTVEKLLQTLIDAETFMKSHAAEATAILQSKLNYDDNLMKAIAPLHRYEVTLDQSLILAMEDEARWQMQNGLTTAAAMPDFLNFIHEDPLKSIKPDAVRIIR